MNGMEQDIPHEVQAWIGRQLFCHVPANIIVIDRDFRVVTANDNFVKVFGDPSGRCCYEVYKRQQSPCKNCTAAQTFADGSARLRDETGIDKNGRPAHYVVHMAPVYNEIGQITHIIEMSHDVTEAASLRGHYNLLFERVPCYVAVINRDLRVVRANELLRRTFGEPSGEHCFRLYKHRETRCEDCPALRTFADGGSYTSRQVGVSKEGAPAIFVVSTAPLAGQGEDFQYVIEMALDVTESERLSERLIREGEVRRKLTESAIDALIATDASGVIQLFNPAAETLFQIPACEAVGKLTAGDLVGAEVEKAIRNSGGALVIPEAQVVNRRGEEIPVRLSAATFRENGGAAGGAVFLQDLRDYKRLEKEKLDSERLAAVGQTVAQLAHGIKNILTGLQGGMYVIKSGLKKGDKDKTDKGWGMLERNVDRITELVKGFLSFAKGREPEVRPSDLNKVAEDVYELYKQAASDQGIDLRFHPAATIEPAAVDPDEIRICVENLVSNAIDACQVSDKTERVVDIRVESQAGAFALEVADTGCGMDYEIKSRVFTTFFTTKGLGGTGLGLLVTRKIVQEHGGRIEVSSEPGKGSVFRIVLPKSGSRVAWTAP